MAATRRMVHNDSILTDDAISEEIDDTPRLSICSRRSDNNSNDTRPMVTQPIHSPELSHDSIGRLVQTDTSGSLNKLRRIMTRIKNRVSRENTTMVPPNISPNRRLSRQMKVLQRTDESDEHLKKAIQGKLLAPDSFWRWSWDGVILIICVYYAVIVPLSWATLRGRADTEPAIPHTAFESLFSLLLGIDMIVQTKTSFVNEKSILVDNPYEARQHYLRTWFAIDLVTMLPLDLLAYGISAKSYFWAITRHLRLLGLFKLSRLFHLSMITNITTSHLYFHFQIVPIVRLAVISTVFVHFCSMVWVVLQSDPYYSYHTSLYFVLYTLSTSGYGDIVVSGASQQLYCCFLFVSAMFVNGWLVGNIASIMSKSDIKTERRNQMRSTLGILRHFNVPYEMRREVLAFQFHLLHHNLSASYAQIIESLPKSMRRRIGLFIRVKFVAEVPLFSRLTTEHQIALAQKLKSVVYEPEEFIIRAGDVGQEMYFLWYGYADIISGEGSFITTLSKGSYFGEMALLSQMTRMASVKALTYCDVFRLDKKDFVGLMEKFPDLKATVELEAASRLKQNEARRLSYYPPATPPLAPRGGSVMPDEKVENEEEIEPHQTIPMSNSTTIPIPIQNGLLSPSVQTPMPVFPSHEFPISQTDKDEVVDLNLALPPPALLPVKAHKFELPPLKPIEVNPPSSIVLTTTTTTTTTSMTMDGLDNKLMVLEDSINRTHVMAAQIEANVMREFQQATQELIYFMNSHIRILEERISEINP